MTGEPFAGALRKPSRTARKMRERKTRIERKGKERDAMTDARKRDGHACRFPRCGCGRLRLRLEVSHQEHRGMGGDPHGLRSVTSKLVLVCSHRHQHGVIAIDKGTLKWKGLTRRGADGPIAWYYRMPEWASENWHLLATETTSGRLWEPFTDRQAEVLHQLAEMKL